MKISPMSADECNTALIRIVSEFGDGYVKKGHYIFDAITRLPPGFVEKKLLTNELISRLKGYVNLHAVFDPNPRNTPFRLQLLQVLGVSEDILGVKIATEDIRKMLVSYDCDFYVLAPDGTLLSVASHEDEIVNNERVMWCPIAVAKKAVKERP